MSLHHLRELMDVDRALERVSAQRAHLLEREELRAAEEMLRTWSQELHLAREALEQARQAYEQQRHESQKLQERRAELDRRLASTSDARELAAVAHERELVHQLASEVEDEELAQLVALEPLELAPLEIADWARPLVQRRTELMASIGAHEMALDDEKTRLLASRHDVIAQVDPAVLRVYEGALARSGTSGAANFDGVRCDGCRIALSPLDADRFKRREPDAVVECPECGRILLG